MFSVPLLLEGQSGDSDEQETQTPPLEDQQIQPLQHQIPQLQEIAQTWSDEKLLSIAAEVKDYFKQPPPEPDVNEAKQLRAELDRLEMQTQQLQTVASQQRQTVETLGKARSWKYPFGSDPQAVKVAETQLTHTEMKQSAVDKQMRQTRSTFGEWQKGARDYLEWRDSEKGQQMHEYRAIIQLEPVQERITQIHQTQEANRQAQERQRKKQKEIEVLREWKEVAIKLGRPERHVQIIQEITEAYWNDIPLKENHLNHMSRDFEDYQELQRQIQSQSHGRGFSR